MPTGRTASVRAVLQWVLLGIPFIAYNAVVFPYLDFMPLWDGRLYFDALLTAVDAPFTLQNFAFFGHPSHAYGLLFAVGQYVSFGSVVALNLTSIVMGNIGLAAFVIIVRKLWPEASRFELTLAGLLFAVQPGYAANTVNFNVDFGVAVWLLVVLALLIHRRYAWGALAGVMLVFTKEIGVLLYAAAAGLSALFFLLPASSYRPSLRRLTGLICTLLLPLLLFASYSVAKLYIWGSFPVWSNGYEEWWQGQLVSMFLRVDLLDPGMRSTIANLFVLNFQWVATALIVCSIMLHYLRLLRGTASSPTSETKLLICLTVVGIYIVTRLVPFTNYRYIMAVSPLVLLLFLSGLQTMFRHASERCTALFWLTLLSVLSLHHSIDPVSARLFGDFAFGGERIFVLANLGHEAGSGYGRDQLVYNLQFTNLARLQDAAMTLVQPTDETSFVLSSEQWLGFRERWDTHRAARSVDADAVLPRYMDVHDVLIAEDPPRTLYALEYPNMPWNSIDPLREAYDIVDVVELRGTGKHAMLLQVLERRDVAHAAAPALTSSSASE